MTKVTIDRELLERANSLLCSYSSTLTDRAVTRRAISEICAILAAPRQPEGEEIAWSLRSDVAGCGLVRYMTDSKYQAQTQAIKQWYEPFRCQQCTDAQRAIAELREECERLRMQLAACGVVALANTPESASEARQMHQDYMSASCSDVAGAVDREMTLRQQRDKPAEILRDIVPGCKWKHMRPRIDAALAEVNK